MVGLGGFPRSIGLRRAFGTYCLELVWGWFWVGLGVGVGGPQVSVGILSGGFTMGLGLAKGGLVVSYAGECKDAPNGLPFPV